MSDRATSIEDDQQPVRYAIRLKGHLDQRWADWFAGLTITLQENGETLLVGPITDQSALHGFLKRVRDLGLPLVSVIQIDPNPSHKETDV